MKNIRIIILFIGGFLCTGIVMAAILFLLNPYGIYGVELVPSVVYNSKAVKERIVQQHYKNGKLNSFDGLIFGTSSIIGFDRETLSEVTGINFFNYAFFNSMTKDALAGFNHFYSLNDKIKMVLIGVDFFAYKDRRDVQEPLAHTQYLKKFLDLKCRQNSQLTIE